MSARPPLRGVKAAHEHSSPPNDQSVDVIPVDKLSIVLDRLTHVRPTSGKWFDARCPAHDDRAPSLRVQEGRRWINLHCHAGCSYDAIRVALGLEWKDLVVDEDTERPTKRRDWRAIELEAEACVHRLQDEPEVLDRLRFKRGWAAAALRMLNVGWDGSRLTLPVRQADGSLHDVLRYGPFAPRRKVLATKGKSRLPWPAPESIDPSNADPLFLVEGEGTAISMLSVGLRAVGLPGSIGKPTYDLYRPGSWQGAGWHKKWADRFLPFRRMVLLPDLDGPGRALMGAARYDLSRLGIDARIVDLGPKTHDGSDVADMLLRGAYDGPRRAAAKQVLREIVAEHAEMLVAA